jgi:hypothetical protein
LATAKAFVRQAWSAVGGTAAAEMPEPEPAPEPAPEHAARMWRLDVENRLRLAGLGDAEVLYMVQSVIARGGAKAVAITQELALFAAVLHHLPDQLGAAVVRRPTALPQRERPTLTTALRRRKFKL